MPSKPFVFEEHHFLVRPLGRKAYDLPSLARGIAESPTRSVFAHVHIARLRPRFQRSGLLNNYASWVRGSLGETRLAEKLAVIDGASSGSLERLRDMLTDLVERSMGVIERGPHCLRGQEFHFCTVDSDVVPMGFEAETPGQLLEGVKSASRESLIHHLYGSSLRGDDGLDDFTRWLRARGDDALADRTHAIPRWTLDPDDARAAVIEALEERA